MFGKSSKRQDIRFTMNITAVSGSICQGKTCQASRLGEGGTSSSQTPQFGEAEFSSSVRNFPNRRGLHPGRVGQQKLAIQRNARLTCSIEHLNSICS